ncbi:dienelactone hydrolase endo-1,3,1,4-beta-D-glucanase [Rhodocollybia butyracea]|uniref:Dienelactone hydrolase endo-1,3,1,4-beta-D-glucanase n=1 Tax=Rhodocollybia butyracea TaxID=206335 RepID=A0A9P5TZM0_9AGAR|nr:dienelactone hydrolase endo-1,3,1,4-beta-D-glucanase [Rhodocollybia butyracea]
MSLCKDCITSVTHEGTPTGKWETIGTINCYDKVIIYLTDGFGPQLVNNRLLADDFAKNGFKTVIPDYLHGDPVPLNAEDPGSNFSVPDWLSRHGPEQTRPPVDKVIAALKEEGVTRFGATGYCVGGRYVFDLSFDQAIQASAISHPTFLDIPIDLEKYFSKSITPLLLNTCELDEWFPPSAAIKADEILGDGKFAPGYKREYFEGCKHGFAVRGDMSKPYIKAAKEGAFKSTVEWMRKYL